MHHWPPHAIAPQTIFFAASGMLAVSSTSAGFMPPSSSKDGRESFPRRPRDDLADHRAAGEKDEVERQFQEFGVLFLAPATTVTALGSKYFGTRSSSTSVVAGSASLRVEMQVLPAASAARPGGLAKAKAR